MNNGIKKVATVLDILEIGFLRFLFLCLLNVVLAGFDFIGLLGLFVFLRSNFENEIYTSSECDFNSIICSSFSDYIFVISFFLFRYILTLAAQFVILGYTYHKQSNLRIRILSSVFCAPVMMAENRNTIFTQVIQHSSHLANCFRATIKFIGDLCVGVGLFLGLYILYPDKLLQASLLGGIVVAVLYTVLSRRASSIGAKLNLANIDLVMYARGLIDSWREWCSKGENNYLYGLFGDTAQAVAKLQTSSEMLSFSPRVVIEAALVLGLLLYVGVGMSLDQVNPGNIIVIVFALLRGLPLMNSFLSFGIGLRHAENSIASLAKLLDSIDRCSVNPGKTIPTGVWRIEVDNLALIRGPQFKKENINFVFKPGNIYRLAGDSGSGKSTLCDYLMGLDESGIGTVNVVCQDQVFSPVKLGGKYYISQSSFLPPGPLLESLGYEESDHKSADKLAVFLELVELEKCVSISDSIVYGRSKWGVSGGQEQRLRLVRGLMHAKRLLIIDEVFAGVDPATTRRILGRLRAALNEAGLMSSLIVIIVTHSGDKAIDSYFDGVLEL